MPLLFLAVPTSLQESPHTVGTAKTSFQQPVSEFAPALESIAGEPVAPDPTAKYAPALGPLTGDSAPSGQGTGIVGAVSAAAGSVVQTVRHVSSYRSLGTFNNLHRWPPHFDLIYPICPAPVCNTL